MASCNTDDLSNCDNEKKAPSDHHDNDVIVSPVFNSLNASFVDDKEKLNMDCRTTGAHAVDDVPSHVISHENDYKTSTVKISKSAVKPVLSSMKKLPDLPADLEPLKIRCTTMSQEVLQLLSQKIKDDMLKTKEQKDNVRTQKLRELSWKVTDMLTLGSSIVKEIEGKSAYQLQKEQGAKKYRNKNNKKWVQPNNNCDHKNAYNSSNKDGDLREQPRNKHSKVNPAVRGSQRKDGNQREYDINKNWRGNSNQLNNSAINTFSKGFVQQIINNSINLLVKEYDAQQKQKLNQKIAMAANLVDSIILKSVDRIIMEASLLKNNLSLTETELLTDMLEESFCSEESSILLNVTSGLSVKSEPVEMK